MPQSLTDIKALLAGRGIHPRHRFGQNFLIDANKLRAIIDAAAITPGAIVLEVGPGTGVLTEELLAAGARVVAVEIDRDMAEILRQRLGEDSERFILINDDVMAGKHALNPAIAEAMLRFRLPLPPGEGRGEGFPVPASDTTHEAKGSPHPNPLPRGEGTGIPQSLTPDPQLLPFKLIANLPYNIASPLLAVLASDWPGMTAAVVMVQREVADRMIAPSGGKDYGPLTVILQALCELKIIAKLSPGCFWPPPDIESAVVQMTRRSVPLTHDPHKLSALLHTLFSQRRKQIGTTLGRDTPLPPGIDATKRPEQLTVEQLVTLAEFVNIPA